MSFSESVCVSTLGLSLGLEVEVRAGESEDVALDRGGDEGEVEEEFKGRKDFSYFEVPLLKRSSILSKYESECETKVRSYSRMHL